MHVVLSKFRVINGMEDAVIDAFRLRPRQVDDEPGFIRMEVFDRKAVLMNSGWSPHGNLKKTGINGSIVTAISFLIRAFQMA